MSWTKLLIDSIKEWERDFSGDAPSLRDVNFMLGYAIGAKVLPDELSLEGLEERINYLVGKEKFREKFIVMGLVNEMSNFLNDIIDKLGEAIINNENMAKQEDETPFDTFSSKLKELKDIMYINKAEEAIDCWNKAVANNFTRTTMREVEREEFLKGFESFKEFRAQLPEADLDISMKELVEKYK